MLIEKFAAQQRRRDAVEKHWPQTASTCSPNEVVQVRAEGAVARGEKRRKGGKGKGEGADGEEAAEAIQE
eukprot:2693249-Pyramimonas_sp.AAC.1